MQTLGYGGRGVLISAGIVYVCAGFVLLIVLLLVIGQSDSRARLRSQARVAAAALCCFRGYCQRALPLHVGTPGSTAECPECGGGFLKALYGQ